MYDEPADPGVDACSQVWVRFGSRIMRVAGPEVDDVRWFDEANGAAEETEPEVAASVCWVDPEVDTWSIC